MKTAICTLFEGDYHYGVGALANSLYAHGFRGAIYAGYRGLLPPWVGAVEKVKNGKQKSETLVSDLRPPTSDTITDFSPAPGLTLRFIPLNTNLHLTNYKPDFMLELWDKHCPEAEAMFYFDPDIVIKARWSFFQEWVDAGVAVCEDVNPSMASNHPIRAAWRRILSPRGIAFQQSFDRYFNCGFVGLSQQHQSFLSDWKKIQRTMGDCGVDFNSLGVGDRTQPFTCRDQDALNITCMATDQPISPMGQDGMDFQHGGGGYVMAHAIGSGKPWKKHFVRSLLCRAVGPSRADKEFFRHAESPIRLFPSTILAFKRARILAASFLGRFTRNM